MNCVPIIFCGTVFLPKPKIDYFSNSFILVNSLIILPFDNIKKMIQNRILLILMF